jgi:phage shock protein PspC (stress-responsive transcriptional regulator)
VRPRHGRVLAGVCAAVGRATNTDPLLWRVIIGVLSVFGIGIVLYLTAWLLTPAEGDTASPLEALFGRGHSSTSTGLTIALAVIAVVFIGGLTDSFVLAVAAAAGLVVVAIAANPRGQVPRPMQAAPPPAQAPALTEPGGYQPPFAPHGPYAGPPPPVPATKEIRPKREPSRLGRLIFGLGLLALGLIGAADLAGVAVPGVVYVLIPLTIVGVGLIVGAWLGRARGHIFSGLLLCLLLPVVANNADYDRTYHPGTVTWTPQTVTEISDSYDHRFGEATLDLSGVDFTGHEVNTAVDISFGDLRVIVPDNVDVIVDSDVSLGDANIFDRTTSGAGVNQTFRDDGPDGPGGGTLTIHLQVKFGHAEVTR